MRKFFNIIVATTRKNGIGFQGSLPWPNIAGDMQHFKNFTQWNKVYSSDNFPYFYQSNISNSQPKITKLKNTRNAVIMGKITWNSIPNNFKPLKNRLNIILSENNDISENQNIKIANSFEKALQICENDSSIHEIFIIGGADTYNQALNKYGSFCKAIFKTRIWKDIKCDKYFPNIPAEKFKLAYVSKTFSQEDKKYGKIPYDFTFYVNNEISKKQHCIDKSMFLEYQKHEEMGYLELVKKVIETGNEKTDRTGTGTKSLFGCTMRYDLLQSFPLLTTKSVYWKGVVEELLWFLRGETNANKLSQKGVKIWDGNGSREFLDKNGLKEREVGDLGPVYGFQWRHFGAEYKNMHENYTGKGTDQLKDVLHKIMHNPDDRRIIMSAWNPAALKKMALPPCHMFSQFYVANGKLSCIMYQRSCDLGLGVPFNIASYSLLTHILANAAGLKVGEYVHILGDAHVYKNHIEPLKEQLKRYPNPFPVLKIKKKINGIEGIENLKFEDFELSEYIPHPKIKMDMAV